MTSGARRAESEHTDRHAIRQLAWILAAMFAGVLLSLLLPDISLTTGFADAVVLLTDTASWILLTPLSVGVVILVVNRPGLARQRRARELASLATAMVLALAGNGLLNEHIVKPALGLPRPNIEQLAQEGALGPNVPDAEAFYASGDKGARRELLAERLTAETTPYLSERVRAHWIHETGYSFPSGHTTAAMTFATLFAALGVRWLNGWRRLITLFVLPVWAVGVALSRTLLEVHTPADVVAGTVAGLLWGLLAFGAVDRLVARSGTATQQSPAVG